MPNGIITIMDEYDRSELETQIENLTASDVGALPVSGGTITGDMIMQKTNNGYGVVYKNHDNTNDFGTVLSDCGSSGSECYLTISAKEQMAKA